MAGIKSNSTTSASTRSMRKYLTTYILASTILIGELHNFWATDPRISNWIIIEYHPMLLQWNVKYTTDQIIPLFYLSALLLYINNKVNRIVARTFLLWSIVDIWLYFYNYKHEGYYQVYFWIAGCITISYFGDEWFNKVFKHIKDWGRK